MSARLGMMVLVWSTTQEDGRGGHPLEWRCVELTHSLVKPVKIIRKQPLKLEMILRTNSKWRITYTTQEIQWTSSRINTERFTNRHMVKMVKDKRKNFENKKKNQICYIQGHLNKINIWLLSRNNIGLRLGNNIFKVLKDKMCQPDRVSVDPKLKGMVHNEIDPMSDQLTTSQKGQ